MKFVISNIIRKFSENLILTNNYFRNFTGNLQKVNFVKYICNSELFIYILKMLSRKVERLDSVKPWQPFGDEEGAKFYPHRRKR